MYDFLSAYLKRNRNRIKRDFQWKDVLDNETTIQYINEHIVTNINVVVNWIQYHI